MTGISHFRNVFGAAASCAQGSRYVLLPIDSLPQHPADGAGVTCTQMSKPTARKLKAWLLEALLPGLALTALFAGSADVHAQGHPRAAPYQPYGSPHWHYDDRYRHGHYYPAYGYAVTVLPAGNVVIAFGGARYYFHGGVFYRPAGPAFVVVRPPAGLIVPVLPPAYVTVWIGGAPYYYANETYYSAVPGGAGYAVVAPPPGAEPTTATPLPPPAASSPQAGQAPGPAAQGSSGNWYYCDAAKGFYPYVQECKEGWRAVPATPPAATIQR